MQINGQLKVAVFEQLAADPTGGGLVQGRFWYNTSTLLFKVYDGTKVQSFIDLDTAQTLASKILNGANISNYLEFNDQGSTPATPVAGKKRLFVAADDKFNYVDEFGNVFPIGSGSGGGGINYLEDANNVDTDWLNSGGALTIADNTISALDGDKDLLISKSAVNGAGSYVYYVFSVRPHDKSKQLALKFDYNTDANIIDGDYEVEIYDVTNALVVTNSNPELLANELGSTHITYFQPSSSSTSYQFRLKTITTSATAHTFHVDNIFCGPLNLTNPGSFISDWEEFTPVWDNITAAPAIGNGTLIGWYRRSGDSAEIRIALQYGSTTTGGTGASWCFGLPSGLSVNSTKLAFGTASPDYKNIVGSGSTVDGTVNGAGFDVRYDTNLSTQTSTAMVEGVFLPLNSGSSNIGPTVPFTWANTDSLNFYYTVPIQGWETGVKPNEVVSGRLHRMYAVGSGTTALTASTQTKLTNWATPSLDESAAWDSANSRYISRESNWYSVRGGLRFTDTDNDITRATISIYKNGASVAGVDHYQTTTTGNATNLSPGIDRKIFLNKGDYVELFVRQDNIDNDNTNTGTSEGSYQYFEVVKDNNVLATISPNDIVVAKYTSTDAQSLPGSLVETTLTYSTKSVDSHNATISGVFNAPLNGLFYCSCITKPQNASYTSSSATSSFLGIKVNGVAVKETNITGSTTFEVDDVVELVSGDTVEFYVRHNGTSAYVLSGIAINNNLTIARL